MICFYYRKEKREMVDQGRMLNQMMTDHEELCFKLMSTANLGMKSGDKTG